MAEDDGSTLPDEEYVGKRWECSCGCTLREQPRDDELAKCEKCGDPLSWHVGSGSPGGAGEM
jgi:hypothetical protein